MAAEGQQGGGYSGGRVEGGRWFDSSEFFLTRRHHLCGLGQDRGTILGLFFSFINP